MSTVLETEPVVLEDVDDPLICRYSGCGAGARWSTIWSCGETIVYCEDHLRWAQRMQPLACACDEEDYRPIYIAMTVAL